MHPEGDVDPMRDIETIETELDLRRPRAGRAPPRSRRARRRAAATRPRSPRRRGCARSSTRCSRASPARAVPAPADAPEAVRNLQPLTSKPVLFVVNVEEGTDEVPAEVADRAAEEGALVGRRLQPPGGRAVRARRRGGRGHARGARRRASRAWTGSSAARSPCSTERVLHGRRGEARPVLAPHARPDRVARGGRDPHGHPEGVRPRRDHRLGRARRGRRLRRRARAGTLRLEGRDYAMPTAT